MTPLVVLSSLVLYWQIKFLLVKVLKFVICTCDYYLDSLYPPPPHFCCLEKKYRYLVGSLPANTRLNLLTSANVSGTAFYNVQLDVPVIVWLAQDLLYCWFTNLWQTDMLLPWKPSNYLNALWWHCLQRESMHDCCWPSLQNL